jgi:hypothetical protein
MHRLRHRYGHAAQALTSTQLRALRHLAEAPGGSGGTWAAKGMTLPVAQALARAGYVTLVVEHVRYTAGRAFGATGAGRLRAGRSWIATITDAGRRAAGRPASSG